MKKVRIKRSLPAILGIAAALMLISCTNEEAQVATGAAVVAAVVVDASESQSDFNPEFGPICDRVAGEWRGRTDKGRTILLTIIQNDRCQLSGVALYEPCVPISTITGTAFLFNQNFEVETTAGSLFVKRQRTLDLDSTGANKSTYRFNNTQNRPGCPPSESGSITLTKIA